MKTEVYIFNLNGNRAAVRNYANTIASMSASNCNAYAMAFNKDNEILWTVQAGDDLDEVKTSIIWQGVRRVEIYDHSVDGTYKTEQIYITSRKSLNEYTAERSASDFVVVNNNTQYTADNWQTEENDNDTQSNESNESNEDEQAAAEPSRLAQAVASIKAYAVKGAQYVAFLFSLVFGAVFSFAVAIGCMSLVLALFDALDITGAVRFALTLAALFGPALELAINIECNLLAITDRIFPGRFPSRMPFECFSFWGRMLCA